jgi:lipopolysaccharide export system protein LptA
MKNFKASKRTRIVGAAAILLASAAAGGAAHAQISSKGGPVDITADALDVNSNDHITTWKGHVEALQDGNRLRADLLNIYYKSNRPAGAPKPAPGAAGAEFGQIDHMDATGDVYFVTPTEVVRGDHAVYTAADDTIVITGKVVLTQGQNVLTGQRMVVNQATGQSRVEGGEGSRPRAVVYPNQKPKDAKSQGSSH